MTLRGRLGGGSPHPAPNPPTRPPANERAQVRYFCFSAGVIIFFLFVLTATFFLALLTLDEHRRARRALDCACCLTYPALATTAPATAESVMTAATESVTDSGGTNGAEAKDGQADGRQANGRRGEQSEDENEGRGGGRGGGSWAHRALRSYARVATHPLVSAVIVALFVSFIPLGFRGTI